MGVLAPGPDVAVRDLHREFVSSDKRYTSCGRRTSTNWTSHQTVDMILHTPELHTGGGCEASTVFKRARVGDTLTDIEGHLLLDV